MIWHESLYLGEGIPKKNRKIRQIKRKINRGAFSFGLFLIVLCQDGTNLLEIIPARDLRQRAYPKKHLYIVGLAKGYGEALETASRIVIDVYKKTGGFAVKQYLLGPQKAGEGT